MRPTKLKPHLITALREITADPTNMLICTDEELFFLLNDCLRAKDRVSYRTFKRYKQRALEYYSGDEELPDDIDPIYEEFYAIIRRATLTMKRNLMRNMMEADKTDWMRYKWVMERKFPDFRPEKEKPKETETDLPVPQFRITTPPLPNWMATAIAEAEIKEEEERAAAMIAAEKERLRAERLHPTGVSNADEQAPIAYGGMHAPENNQQTPSATPADASLNGKAPNGIPWDIIRQQEENEAAHRNYWGKDNPNRPRAAGKIYGFY